MIGTTTDTEQAIRLVLGVARLGEQGRHGWWRSHGLGQAGPFVLGRSFPRTARPAALELDILSAAHRHDDLLERPTAPGSLRCRIGTFVTLIMVDW